MNKKKATLIEKIAKCKKEADSLKPNINKFEPIMTLYNKKIIEKAVLSKELRDFDQNLVIKLVQKVVPNRQKLICDYWD